MKHRRNHHTVRGSCASSWIFLQKIIVIHLIRQLLVNVFVMKQSRPTEHYAKVFVQNIDAPKYAFPHLQFIAGTALLRWVAGTFSMQAQCRNHL
jgi:hypothetical protein